MALFCRGEFVASTFDHCPQGFPGEEGGEGESGPEEVWVRSFYDLKPANSAWSPTRSNCIFETRRWRVAHAPVRPFFILHHPRPRRHRPGRDRGQYQDRRESEAEPSAFGLVGHAGALGVSCRGSSLKKIRSGNTDGGSGPINHRVRFTASRAHAYQGGIGPQVQRCRDEKSREPPNTGSPRQRRHNPLAFGRLVLLRRSVRVLVHRSILARRIARVDVRSRPTRLSR